MRSTSMLGHRDLLRRNGVLSNRSLQLTSKRSSPTTWKTDINIPVSRDLDWPCTGLTGHGLPNRATRTFRLNVCL